MARILLAYGTTEGHTAKIARRMAEAMREGGHDVEVADAKEFPARTLEDGYDGIIVGGSVHVGGHQSSVREFVRRNRVQLEGVPSAFFSVSLTAADPDDDARRDVHETIDKFLAETGWTPERIEPIAGALVYTQYNLFVRHLMKLIAKRHGRPTDTSQDHDYTDWQAVEAFARGFAESVEGRRE